jgi:hypothetical protein
MEIRTAYNRTFASDIHRECMVSSKKDRESMWYKDSFAGDQILVFQNHPPCGRR